jgi:hypothetical protein
MTVAMLAAPAHPETGSPRSLEEALDALVQERAGECLVCGAHVEVDRADRVACDACGAVLDPPPEGAGQLGLL